MKKVTLECEFVTPAFIGGHHHKLELRTPSLLGAMRWWWRTVQNPSNKEDLLGTESLIFGGIKQNGGRESASRFKIKMSAAINNDDPLREGESLKDYKCTLNVRAKGRNIPINLLDYLAYGLVEWKEGEGNVLTRAAYRPGTQFMIDLSFYRGEHIEDVLFSLWCLHRFGGIGARSRNGWGSFWIRNLPKVLEQCNLNEELFLERLRNSREIRKKDPDQIPYSQFTSLASFYFLKENQPTWYRALGKLAEIYREIRTSLEKSQRYDKRKYFAAPLTVNKRNEADVDRRASSLILKVRPDGQGYRGGFLFLPYRFHQEKYNKGIYVEVLNHILEKLKGNDYLKREDF